MLTLTAQSALSLCLLAFAVTAFRIARALPRSDAMFRYAWMLTAGAFGLQSVNSAFHDAFSIFAFVQGPDTAAWNAIMVWHPILNHSRTFLLTAFCLTLAAALVRAHRRRPLPPLRWAVAVVAGGMVLGGIVGWREHAFSALTHFTAVAAWDIMELLAMMTLLLVGLTTGGMDRSLWVALSVNACSLALSVLWFAYLSRIEMGGQWAPRPSHIHAAKVLLNLMMVAIAARFLVQLRRGGRPHGFFDSRTTLVGSLHG